MLALRPLSEDRSRPEIRAKAGIGARESRGSTYDPEAGAGNDGEAGEAGARRRTKGLEVRLPGPGSIEVICGSMFSGKSEELIRRLTRAKIARQRVQVFKPRIDDRYSEVEVVSHGGLRLTALAVASSGEILERTQDRTEVVGIDEAQFFDPGLVDVAGRLADLGKRVLVAGLDQDYLGRPFEPMPALMAAAEDVTKMRAICMRCGAPASRTQRLVASNERVVVGAAGLYEARCRRCFEPGVAPVDGDLPFPEEDAGATA